MQIFTRSELKLITHIYEDIGCLTPTFKTNLNKLQWYNCNFNDLTTEQTRFHTSNTLPFYHARTHSHKHNHSSTVNITESRQETGSPSIIKIMEK